MAISATCFRALVLIALLQGVQAQAVCNYPTDTTDPCSCEQLFFININSSTGIGDKVAKFNTTSTIELQQCDVANLTNNKLLLNKDVNVNCEHNLNCPYSCDGNDGRSFQIVVTFIDTTPPTFDESLYTAHVQEEVPVNTTLFKIKNQTVVTEPDCGDTGLNYDMNDFSASGFFRLSDASTAFILTAQRLDYDTMATKNFNLTIFGANKQTATATVQVFVDDIDDKNPAFDNAQHTLNVTEESQSNDWLKTSPPMICKDLDTGINTPVSYAFEVNNSYIDTTSHLMINRTTGELQVIKSYDLETVPSESLQLAVWCYQDNDAKKNETATLHINVIDINDNLPIFDPVVYNVTVNENTVGYIVTVTATDNDVGDNGLFSYEIVDGDDKFTVNGQTGEITVRENFVLDRDTQPSLSVIVRGVEKAGNYSSNNATVTILLTDMNDNSPVFIKPHFAFPFNTSVSGTMVGQVSATDGDVPDTGNSNVTYAITSSWTENTNTPPVLPLAFDPLSGIITVAGQVGLGLEYNLLVRACDNPDDDNDRRCETVRVVCVFNPNAIHGPVRVDQNMTVAENVPPGTIIDRLQITGDYYVTDTADSFEVDLFSHMLKTKIPLDRESRDRYDIQVNVSSNSLGDLATVNVQLQILDTNDHAPSFGQDVYYFTLPHTGTDEYIGNMNATDDDIGDNGNLTFVFYHETNTAVFRLDPVTGEIRLRDYPDQSFYQLLAMVADHGVPPLQDSVPVYIAQLETPDATQVKIIVSSYPEYVNENKEYFEGEIANVLQLPIVTISDVSEVMTSRSTGGVTRAYLTFSASNGSLIQAAVLQRAVFEHWTGIQDLFRQPLVPQPTSDEGLQPAEIALIAVAVVMLVGGVLCVFVVCRQYDRHIKNHRLYDNLSRRSTVYDSQEMHMQFGDETVSQANSRMSTFRVARRDTADTELEGSFGHGLVNSAFSDDGDNTPKTPTWSTSGTPRIPKWSTSDSLQDAMESLDDLASRLNAEDNISRVTSMSRSRRSVKSAKSDPGETTPDSVPVYANVTITSGGDDDYITPIVDYPAEDADADTSALKYDKMDLTMRRDDVTDDVTQTANTAGGITEAEGTFIVEATAF